MFIRTTHSRCLILKRHRGAGHKLISKSTAESGKNLESFIGGSPMAREWGSADSGAVFFFGDKIKNVGKSA